MFMSLVELDERCLKNANEQLKLCYNLLICLIFDGYYWVWHYVRSVILIIGFVVDGHLKLYLGLSSIIGNVFVTSSCLGEILNLGYLEVVCFFYVCFISIWIMEDDIFWQVVVWMEAWSRAKDRYFWWLKVKVVGIMKLC